MENASKALLMAAGVLIGIMILSLISYLYISFSSSADNIQKDIELAQIENFNNKFLVYDGRKDMTLYDMQTVVNLAKENNDYYGLTEASEDNYYITVDIDSEKNVEQKDFEITLEKLNNEDYMHNYNDTNNRISARLTKYICSVNINPNTTLVNYIKFTKNSEQD